MKLNIVKLKKILKDKGVNQTWLADEMGSSRQNVSKWFVYPEKISLAGITAIANVVDVDPKELIGY